MLIQGETGTGKELVAKAIHNNSPRKNKNFVAMNCTAINENLLEDELFGHEPGAFTGADKLRKGRFEYANGGTLFLDEIGDMPLTCRRSCCGCWKIKRSCRIGSNEPIKVNVRLISATHRDLEAAVAAGTFRQDLYYRLKVVTIKLPPLRERRQDIPLLAAHFIKESNQRYGKKVDRHRRSPAQADRRLRMERQRPRTPQRHRQHGRPRSRRRSQPQRRGGRQPAQKIPSSEPRGSGPATCRQTVERNRALLHREDART